MVENLSEKNWDITAYDVNDDAKKKVEEFGVKTTDSIAGLFENRQEDEEMILWLQIPYKFVEGVIEEMEPLLKAGDTVVDAGNSPYKLDVERSERLGAKDVVYMDVGISGGVEGARHGACVMIGGKKEKFEEMENLFEDISLPKGYQYLGKSGSGHYVKMVHNGIEYSIMQGIAEGFDLMDQSEFDLDLKDVVRIYQQQSIITSRLMGWLGQGFDEFGVELDEVSGSVGALGEGLWTIETAHEKDIKMPALEAAYQTRIDSQENPTYRGKLVQTMRRMFGGHVGVTKISE